MAPKKDTANGSSGKMTKEEERLLLESSRQVTGTTSALFYGNALIVSALPICKSSLTELFCSLYCMKLLYRAVLASADDGSINLRDILHCPDPPLNLAGVLFLQEDEGVTEAQVRALCM